MDFLITALRLEHEINNLIESSDLYAQQWVVLFP